jgi:hypothetical protein
VPPSPSLAAKAFAAITGLVCLFQLALALGAPWGRFAMGGAFPGTLPPAMRVAALVQIGVLALVALVVLARAGLVLPRWRPASRWLAWVVVALTAVAVTLNLITPSGGERMIWAPVAIVMLLAALRVALSKASAR